MFGRAEREYEDAIEHYADVFPEEVREAVKAFNNRVRQAIIGALLCEGELSFVELRDLLGLKNSRMWPHLQVLERGGLIENFLREEFKERKYSFYRISPYGQKFVKSLFESLSTKNVLIIPPGSTQSYSTSFRADVSVPPEGERTVVWAPTPVEFTYSRVHLRPSRGGLQSVRKEASKRS